MAKITKEERPNGVKTIQAKTKDSNKVQNQGYKWWEANSKAQLKDEILSTAAFLKEQQQYRYRQASVFARLYSNQPIFNFLGANLMKANQSQSLPLDRPTMNVIQSCIDTLVSRVTQSKPKPTFLTDNGNYKNRSLAKQMNSFINGEFYQTKAYELGALQLRDACVLGTGVLKYYETPDHRVGLDRVLAPELLVDPNDAYYGKPQQMFQLKLVDKAVLAQYFPEYKSTIARADAGYPDAQADKTIADQIIVVEAWRLPSAKDAGDGKHAIVCSAGTILDEPYGHSDFPFIFLHYNPPLTGFWGQGLCEQLMGTQVEVNKLLMTISQSINLVGVPRVFVEQGSKVVKAHLNNNIGSIVTYSGVKPSYEVAPCVPVELYSQLERLVQYAYQQSGISALAATAQKPSGLNSGTAIRSYDDLQTDRFASLSKRVQDAYIDLGYGLIRQARVICEEQGSYQTIYPNKDGVREIDLPEAKRLDDPFVIQCFDESALPRDPAGRKEWVVDMMKAGVYSPQEGRRLLGFPDTEQVDTLANASEERILKILDEIVEEGKYTPPDPFMDIPLAEMYVTQYYNLYEGKKLEESKAQKLRNFFTQIQALKQAAKSQQPSAMMMPQQGSPQAVPEGPPVSELIPNVPQ
jgi:hypothetical protein